MSQYDSLKDYLELNYKKTIIQGINDYIKKKFSESENRIKDITIRTLAFGTTFPMDCLSLTIGVAATLFDSVDNNSDTRYYNIMLSGDITIGFSNLCVMIVEEATEESLQTETVLSLFGLPDVSRDSLEDEAERIHAVLTARIPINDKHRYWFPVIKIKEKYGMKMWPANLDKGVLGQIRFVPSRADIYDIKDMSKRYPDEPIPSNSILLNSKYYTNEADSCDDVITAAHEFVHWYHHQLYFLIMQLLDNSIVEMSCSSEPIAFDDSMSLKDKAYWYAEWQANELSMRLTMPKHLVERAIDEYNKDESVQSVHNHADMPFSGMYYQNMIYKLSCDFNVPVEIMKRRLRQLGYDFADGTFITVDDCTYQPFTFTYGTLKENETFVIDRSNYERLLSKNKDFAELIESGRYVYLGYVVCLFDAKYIDVEKKEDGIKLVLSDYAREHADECLLKFQFRNESDSNLLPPYYGASYLNKIPEYNKIVPESFELCEEDTELDPITIGQIKEYNDTLTRLNSPELSTLANTIVYYMKEKEIDDKELHKRIGLSIAAIEKIYTGKTEKVNIKNVMALCIGLQLDSEECYDMFEKAGYNIREDTLRNRAYRYLFNNTFLGLKECNKILRYFGQEELPDHKKKLCETEK